MTTKTLLLIIALSSLIMLSGCNWHSANWDRESCRIAGYEEPLEPDNKDIVKCRDNCGNLEVGIHYKKLEILREFPNTIIQVDYTREIKSEGYICYVCECEE